MKTIRKIIIASFIYLIALSACYANEIGFSAGLTSLSFGEVRLYSDNYKPLNNSGVPFQVYSVLNRFKISYLHYEQQAQYDRYDGTSNDTYIYTALIKNDVLLLLYQGSFFSNPNKGYYDFKSDTFIENEASLSYNLYWNFGVGFFNSSMDWNGWNFKTDELLNLGYTFGLGTKKYFNNFFTGLELIYLNKSQNFPTASGYSSIKADISALILFITSGAEF